MRGKIILGLLGVGVVLIIVWIAQNTYWVETEVPMPLKNEAATNPFYAAERFVENLGASSQWDRIQVDVPSDGVIVLSSWHWTLVDARRLRMENWVEEGGRLVMDRSLIGGEARFSEWSGISWRNPRDDNDDDEEDEDVEDEPPAFVSAPRCRSLSEAVRAEGRPPVVGNLQFCANPDRTYLTTTRKVAWALRDQSGYQILRINIGKGSVTVVNGVPFRFRALLEGDNARLLGLSMQLRRGDDVHFLSEEGHTSILTLMWVYGWPVVLLVLALIGLALWRNSVRFGPPIAELDSARRSLAEQIRGTGQFVMRFGDGKALHAAAVRALDEAAQRRISAYRRMPVNERIEAVARLAGLEASALAPAINHSGPRRAHELRQALALIETARRRLLIEKGR